MTQEETPWCKAWEDRPRHGTGDATISVIDLEDFFSGQTTPAPLAAYGHELRKRREKAELELAELPPLDAGRLAAATKSFSPSARFPAGGG